MRHLAGVAAATAIASMRRRSHRRGRTTSRGRRSARCCARRRRAASRCSLDFGAVWCGPCKMLDAELARPELAEALEAFALTRYDAERGEGAKAADRYKVFEFPTLIVVDGAGNELSRQAGFDPERVGPWLHRWSAVATSDAAAAEQLKKTPDDVRLLWAMATRAEARHDDGRAPSLAYAHRGGGQDARARRGGRGGVAAAQARRARQARRDAAADAAGVRARASVARRHRAGARGRRPAPTKRRSTPSCAAPPTHRRATSSTTSSISRSAPARSTPRSTPPSGSASSRPRTRTSSIRSPRCTTIAASTIAPSRSRRRRWPRRRAARRWRRILQRYEKRGSDPSPEVQKPSLVGDLLPDDGGGFQMPPMPPAELAKRQFAHESARVAAACGKSWPKELDEAYARITLGTSAHAEAVETARAARVGRVQALCRRRGEGDRAARRFAGGALRRRLRGASDAGDADADMP